MSNWEEYAKIANKENRSFDIEKYEWCKREFQSGHNSRMMTKYVFAILFLGAGLWALYYNFAFIAVLLLGLAAYFNLESSHHILMSETLNAQWLLALLINKNTRDLEAFRWELKQERDSKSS
jgi:hypothetical protein